MNTYGLVGALYRIGPETDPWALPNFQRVPKGRWDDPDQQHRVRYAAFTRYGALVERLQRYRPDLDLLEQLANVNSADQLLLRPGIPPAFFKQLFFGRARLRLAADVGLLDLASAPGMSAAYALIQAASRRAGHGISDYDAATLLSANPRKFTQAISSIVLEDTDFGGIVYRSRFDPDELCVALFDQRHSIEEKWTAEIDRSDPEFRRACDVHHLPYPEVDRDDLDSEALPVRIAKVSRQTVEPLRSPLP
jgi:hypothetical protein